MMNRASGWMFPAAALFFFCLFRFVFFWGFVPSESMEPTIPAGSFIWGTRLYGELKIGDVIVFEHQGQYLVKRIAGCPGDIIDLTKISYMDSYPFPNRGTNFLVVPENWYYVLGDNVQNSIDSRYWDNPFVSESAIYAVVQCTQKMK